MFYVLITLYVKDLSGSGEVWARNGVWQLGYEGNETGIFLQALLLVLLVGADRYV